MRAIHIFSLCIIFLCDVWLPAKTHAADLPAQPLEIAVGIEIDQITGIDQKAENFGAVVNTRMQWKDPALAFEKETYGDDHKVLSINAFEELANAARTTVPFFIFQNQQAQRWQQEALISVSSNGDVEFFERSTLTLQAPYFDFRRYPFDTQQFTVEVVSVPPQEEVRYTVLEGYYGLGDLLGEEAWILENPEMQISSHVGLTGEQSAKASLVFTGKRHIEYYSLRIFLPLLVLLSVSWFSFFLEDYGKRIDIAGANLLVFVAFNFAISDSLPQLGYLTFLDFILQWMFLITGAAIIINVALRRAEIAGKEKMARRIDNYLIKWILPIGYGTVVAFAVLFFLVETPLAD